jgi:hypothetical protein
MNCADGFQCRTNADRAAVNGRNRKSGGRAAGIGHSRPDGTPPCHVGRGLADARRPSVLWGGSFFFAKIAVGESAALTLRARTRRDRGGAADRLAQRDQVVPWPDRWRPFLVMGLLNNALPFSLIFWGQTHIASGLAAILNATTPLFTVLVRAFRDPPTRSSASARLGARRRRFRRCRGHARPDLLREISAPHVAPQLACLGAALSYAFAGVYGRRFLAASPRCASRPASSVASTRAARTASSSCSTGRGSSRRRARTAWAHWSRLRRFRPRSAYLLYLPHPGARRAHQPAAGARS